MTAQDLNNAEHKSSLRKARTIFIWTVSLVGNTNVSYSFQFSLPWAHNNPRPAIDKIFNSILSTQLFFRSRHFNFSWNSRQEHKTLKSSQSSTLPDIPKDAISRLIFYHQFLSPIINPELLSVIRMPDKTPQWRRLNSLQVALYSPNVLYDPMELVSNFWNVIERIFS